MKKILEYELRQRLPESFVNMLRAVYLKAIWSLYKTKYFFKYGHADFFGDLNIELNTSCNRRCKYCPNSIYERGLIENNKQMEEEVFKKIIDELAEIKFNGRISPQFYGEPLLDKRLVGLMKHARKKLPKAKLVLISNGDNLTIEMFKELVDSGIDRFIITQHGETMGTAMTNLFAYLQDRPTLKKKIEYLHFKADTPLSNRGGLVNPEVQLTLPRCAYPENPVIIDYAGDVVLCCQDYLKSVVFGNVKNQKLTDIWFSKRYGRMRKQFRNMEFSLPICKKCIGIATENVERDRIEIKNL